VPVSAVILTYLPDNQVLYVLITNNVHCVTFYERFPKKLNKNVDFFK